MTKRGIVISPPFEVLRGGGINCGGSPSPADLRKYLLYWDEIDYPDNNFVSVGGGPDIDFLIQAKVGYPHPSSISGCAIVWEWRVLPCGAASGL